MERAWSLLYKLASTGKVAYEKICGGRVERNSEMKPARPYTITRCSP